MRVMTLAICMLFLSACSGESNSKIEFDFLARLDVSKYANVSTIVVFSADKYKMAAIPCSSGTVVVLLNPQYEPYYKQIGECNFAISHEGIHKIVREYPRLNRTVLECLRSHISCTQPCEN